MRGKFRWGRFWVAFMLGTVLANQHEDIFVVVVRVMLGAGVGILWAYED